MARDHCGSESHQATTNECIPDRDTASDYSSIVEFHDESASNLDDQRPELAEQLSSDDSETHCTSCDSTDEDSEGIQEEEEEERTMTTNCCCKSPPLHRCTMDGCRVHDLKDEGNAITGKTADNAHDSCIATGSASANNGALAKGPKPVVGECMKTSAQRQRENWIKKRTAAGKQLQDKRVGHRPPICQPVVNASKAVCQHATNATVASGTTKIRSVGKINGEWRTLHSSEEERDGQNNRADHRKTDICPENPKNTHAHPRPVSRGSSRKPWLIRTATDRPFVLIRDKETRRTAIVPLRLTKTGFIRSNDFKADDKADCVCPHHGVKSKSNLVVKPAVVMSTSDGQPSPEAHNTTSLDKLMNDAEKCTHYGAASTTTNMESSRTELEDDDENSENEGESENDNESDDDGESENDNESDDDGESKHDGEPDNDGKSKTDYACKDEVHHPKKRSAPSLESPIDKRRRTNAGSGSRCSTVLKAGAVTLAKVALFAAVYSAVQTLQENL